MSVSSSGSSGFTFSSSAAHRDSGWMSKARAGTHTWNHVRATSLAFTGYQHVSTGTVTFGGRNTEISAHHSVGLG